MKTFFNLTVAILAVIIGAWIASTTGTVAGLMAGVIAMGAIAATVRPASANLCLTLSVNEILMDTLDAFKTMVPQLKAFSLDFSSATARKDDTITAHIASLPSVQDYDAAQGGFKNGATAVTGLLEDVPVALSRLKHVPVKIAYLSQIASRKDLYTEAIKNQAYVLGKSMVDYALSLGVLANFSQETVLAVGNSDLSGLETIRTALNSKKAAPIGRFGFVSSAVAAILEGDSRVSSKDYYAQLNGGNGYRTYKNIAGFENVWEYPDFPANGQNMTGFFGDRRAVVIASRLPNVQNLAEQLGIPSVMRFETVTDPDTGLTLMGVCWQEQGTADVYVSVAVLYGASAGAQGGAAASKTDYAGHRLVTIATA